MSKRMLKAMLIMIMPAVINLYAEAQVQIDPDLPDYKPVSGVSGSIKSVGSDTMNNLMTLWGEGFRKYYPNVQIEIEGKGSSTAPPALIEGAAGFAPMSRAMKEKEIDSFVGAFGYQPTLLQTAIDVLAVYVNKDNPIPGLSLAEVDAIFSKTRKRGYPKEIRTWGDAGLKDSWSLQPVSLYGRNSASGTYGFFKEIVLGDGDFKDSVKEQPGSSSVVQGIASDRYGVGYSGIGYKTADVRALPLSSELQGEFIEPTAANAYSGDYPLSRFLYLYINHKPGTELDPLRREFVKYIFSRQGQQDVVKDGYFPVSARLALEALQSVGIQP